MLSVPVAGVKNSPPVSTALGTAPGMVSIVPLMLVSVVPEGVVPRGGVISGSGEEGIGAAAGSTKLVSTSP